MMSYILFYFLFLCLLLLYTINCMPIKLNDTNLEPNVTTKRSICLVEGDIICPDDYGKEKNVPTVYLGPKDKNRLWLKRLVPFLIDASYSEAQSKIILEAVKEIESSVSCLKFKLLSTKPNDDEDYIWIQPLEGCYSAIGRQTGKQDLSLTAACFTSGKGTIIHEFMHALGIWHEHTRPDRDNYVYVYFEHILTEAQDNYKKRPQNMVDLVGEPYDYYSIMHYGAYDFSIDPSSLPTLWPLDEEIDAKEMGQRSYITELDKSKLSKLYRCDITHCADPGTPSGGKRIGNEFNVGSSVTFSCDPGLALIGSKERYCRLDGLWSGHDTMCLKSLKLYHYCNFEDGWCDWVQEADNDFDWERRSGATPTEDTGPMEDFTLGTINGHYIYIETSPPQRRGDKARVSTPVFTITETGFVCISFAHYMWGDRLGSLSLYIHDNTIGDKLIWEEEGGMDPNWVEVKLAGERVADDPFRVIFEGIVGAAKLSDIALDEVIVMECSKDEAINQNYKLIKF